MDLNTSLKGRLWRCVFENSRLYTNGSGNWADASDPSSRIEMVDEMICKPLIEEMIFSSLRRTNEAR